jgi:SAM-dependent methyltransferase
MNRRAEQIGRYFDALAPERDKWYRRNRYYHDDHVRYFRYLVGSGKRVLELGCGDGSLLAALDPTVGVGIDVSPSMVALARQRHPHLDFRVGDAGDLPELATPPFDVIILSDLVGYLDDVQQCLEKLHRLCHADTRVIVSYYNFLWQPVLRVGEWFGAKMKTPEQSWLSPAEITNLLTLADFETVKIERRLLFPKYLPLVSWLFNHIGALPLFNRACLNHYVVARPLPRDTAAELSSTIVIPCRNEKGNIEAAVQRLPRFGKHQEIIFVDGHSSDGTPEEIRRVIAAYPQHDIKLMTQDGTGKADAVRKGFDAARGDVLMILDADLTVPPEDLPKFYDAIATNKGEFLNGCRLVYPMQDQAMRTLNLIANKLFAMAFSWMLGQPLKDTLCGTKVIRRDAYRRLVANRAYFGEFDPFGDFDLIFGASKLNLKIIEIPIRYQNRTYGETKIHRFRHGLLLLRMVAYAYRKLKAV